MKLVLMVFVATLGVQKISGDANQIKCLAPLAKDPDDVSCRMLGDYYWGFDSRTGKCVEFDDGCIEKNANTFSTEKLCQDYCVGKGSQACREMMYQWQVSPNHGGAAWRDEMSALRCW